MVDFSDFAPVRAEETVASASHPPGSPAPADAPAATPAPSPSPAHPAPKRVGAVVLPRTFPLQAFGVEYAGKVYTSITLRRPSSAEVGLYFERLAEDLVAGGEGVLRFPIFVDDEGNPVPDVVLDALDDDDLSTINGCAEDFLPARLRRLRTASVSASLSASGDNTGPTS